MAAERRESGVLTGHMVRAERALRESIGVVEVVWEVADARCPRASRNPRLARLCGRKARVIVLAKRDLAEQDATEGWLARLRGEAEAIALDLSGPLDPDPLWAASRAALGRAGARDPGREGFRALVAGVPNTGKSTLLNRLIGERRAAVGARGGITRGPQWLRLQDVGHLLDLPGVLAPRLAGWPVAWRLWAVGAVGPEAVDSERAGEALAEWIRARSPRALEVRYGIDECAGADGTLLGAIALRRGLLGSGGTPQPDRAAACLLADFRRGHLGAITLEDPVEAAAPTPPGPAGPPTSAE